MDAKKATGVRLVSVLLVVLLGFNLVLGYQSEQRRINRQLIALAAGQDALINQCDRIQAELRRHEAVAGKKRAAEDGGR